MFVLNLDEWRKGNAALKEQGTKSQCKYSSVVFHRSSLCSVIRRCLLSMNSPNGREAQILVEPGH